MYKKEVSLATLQEKMMEDIRQRIKEFIAKGNAGINVPPHLEEVLVSICMEFYKVGVKDGFRMVRHATDAVEKEFKK